MNEGLILSIVQRLRKQRWFILEQTPYGTGMCSPAREDVLSLIEELYI